MSQDRYFIYWAVRGWALYFLEESPGDILGPIAGSVWGPYNGVRLPWQDGAKFRGRAGGIEQHLRRHADGFLVVSENHLRGSPARAGQMLHNLANYAAEGFSDGDSAPSGPFVFMGETTPPNLVDCRWTGAKSRPAHRDSGQRRPRVLAIRRSSRVFER